MRDRAAAQKRAGRTFVQSVYAVAAAMAARYPDRGRLAGAIKVVYGEAL